LFSYVSCIIAYNVFKPIFITNELIIPYGLNPFDICQDNPVLWYYLKMIFVIFYLFSSLIISFILFNKIFRLIKIIPIINIKKILRKILNKNFKKKFNKFSRKKSKNVFNNKSVNILIGEKENGEKIYIPEKGLFQNFLITRYNRDR